MSSSSVEERPARLHAGARVASLAAGTYRRHEVHGDDRAWPETNCYTDLLIELLHGLGFEPLAMLGFTVAIDFEGDQWTFFKPVHAELYELYGLDVQELAISKPLADHVEEQVLLGRPVLAEVDSWFLPDTAGSAYRRAHVKSTIGVNEIDVARRTMGYFHNAGYYELEGADFADLFLLDGSPHERMLPPYVEFVKRRPRFVAPRGSALLEAARPLLRRHVERAPVDNPFLRFAAGFTADLERLQAADISAFHAYSFATLRQYGSCFELAEAHLRWFGDRDLADAATAFHEIARTAKAFQFQLARAMARRQPLDRTPLDVMAAQWDRGMRLLHATA